MAVLNKHKSGIPVGAVYIGRGSPWGNPFSHMSGTKAQFQVSSRDEACDKFAEWFEQMLRENKVDIQALADLHGKDLVCFCAPQRCHGHTLEQWAKRAYDHLYPEGQLDLDL